MPGLNFKEEQLRHTLIFMIFIYNIDSLLRGCYTSPAFKERKLQ